MAGIAGGGKAVMNAGNNWGVSEYGGQWFQVAMHEIGHVIGLGHSYDLPALTIQGGGSALTGATRVTDTLRAMGLRESLVRRPYIIEPEEGRAGHSSDSARVG